MKLLYIILISLLFVSCNSDNKNEIEIRIRGLESCVQIVKIDETGNAVFSRGVTSESYKSDSDKIERINLTKEFKVSNEKDLTFIKEQIEKLESKEFEKFPFLLDAQRYVLYFNGEKRIDSYGFKSIEILDIMKKLHKYIPEKIVYNCD